MATCDRPVVAWNLCMAHYQRLRLRGDLRADEPIGYKPPPKPKTRRQRPNHCLCPAHTGDEAWHGQSKGYKYHRCRCDECLEAGRAGERERNPNRVASKYGLTVEQYRALTTNARCEICGTEEPGFPGWCVDHDHACCDGQRTCGECIRGVLCPPCNSLLGSARDNPATLRAAADYLVRHRRAQAGETEEPFVFWHTHQVGNKIVRRSVTTFPDGRVVRWPSLPY